MSSLVAVISPAKLLEDQTHYPQIPCTEPQFAKEAETLMTKLKKLKTNELCELLEISQKLGEENKLRNDRWKLPFDHTNAQPAILLFKGEVYRGLQAETFGKKELDFASNHLRILSGLYGILRPLDLVMSYRLMMGTPFSPDKKHKNLYSFWDMKITEALKADVDKKGVVVNLASSEYFKVIHPKELDRRIVTCEFREKKGSGYSVVNTYAKQARGSMARFIIEHKIKKEGDLKAFDTDRYSFNASLSSDDKLVFTR